MKWSYRTADKYDGEVFPTLQTVELEATTAKEAYYEIMGRNDYFDGTREIIDLKQVKMAYPNRNYGGGNRGYKPRSYGRNNTYNRAGGRRKTGCRMGTYTNASGEQRPMVRGWRPDPSARSGFQSIICVPKYKPTPKSGSKIYENWVATISDSMGKRKANAIYNTQKGIVTIPDYGLLLSPKGQGFCGRIRKR